MAKNNNSNSTAKAKAKMDEEELAEDWPTPKPDCKTPAQAVTETVAFVAWLMEGLEPGSKATATDILREAYRVSRTGDRIAARMANTIMRTRRLK